MGATGNLTFCAVSLGTLLKVQVSRVLLIPHLSQSILIPASSGNHLIINMSWLVGSAGTVVLDLMVLGQFFYYAK